jgi:hypothetical protein
MATGGLDGGPEAAGGDVAGVAVGALEGYAAAHGGAALGAQAHAKAAGAELELSQDAVGARKAAGAGAAGAAGLADGPGKVRLDGGGRHVDVAA